MLNRNLHGWLLPVLCHVLTRGILQRMLQKVAQHSPTLVDQPPVLGKKVNLASLRQQCSRRDPVKKELGRTRQMNA